MDYEQFFADGVSALKRERQYRLFADLEREADRFPSAVCRVGGEEREITVWCSNDYLGIGQNLARGTEHLRFTPPRCTATGRSTTCSPPSMT
jgi:7-keto-8-aminopelargonate synthetase-like enzyme